MTNTVKPLLFSASPKKSASAIAIACIVAYAIVLPTIAPASLHEPALTASRLAPSIQHPFGTDYAGHDLFVRVALGLRISLLIACACALSSTVIGVVVGTAAALRPGLFSAVVMRVTDTVNALPQLLLGIVLVALFRGSVTAIIISIAATHWPQVARIVRSETLTIREMEYVDSAYLAGATRLHVFFKHVLPATLSQAVIAIVMLLPHAVWHESTLSFLGLGLSPDQASLGTLLQESRGEILLGGWWTLLFPASFLVITALAVNGTAKKIQTRFSPQRELAVVR